MYSHPASCCSGRRYPSTSPHIRTGCQRFSLPREKRTSRRSSSKAIRSDLTYKVHIDGVNLLPYLSGEVTESPRKSFFYVSDDGDILAVRMGDWKMVLMEQRSKQPMCRFEPFVKLRAPKMFNLRRDPFERADENSNTYALSHPLRREAQGQEWSGRLQRCYGRPRLFGTIRPPCSEVIAAEALDAFDRVVTYRVGQAIRCWQAERPGGRYDVLPGGTDHEFKHDRPPRHCALVSPP